MKLHRWALIAVFLLLLVAFGCAKPKEATLGAEEQITVSAAISLREALEEAAASYSKGKNLKINFNFGSSGKLQQQVEQGAPVDLFISAGKKQMDELEKKGLLDAATRKDVLGNELVLIAPAGSALVNGPSDLGRPEVKKIGIGEPQTVPAGSYAREALQSLSLWEGIQPKLVLADDVRQVLTYVETGNVEAGVVYRSDAAASAKVKIASTFEKGLHQPILYPVAVIGASKEKEAAGDFLSYLAGPEAAQVFVKHGFIPLSRQ